MRILSRAALLGSLVLAAATAQPAAAADSLTVGLSPNKGGSLLLGAPTTFSIKALTPDVPYGNDGNTRLSAIKVNMPEQLLFNTTGFTLCQVSVFMEQRVCPAKSKLGDVDMTVDGGPDFPSPIAATAELYFGSGFTVLAFVHAAEPAPIDEPVVGELRSSRERGYGLQIYIPVPGKLSAPIDNVYPVVRSMDATVTPPTRKVKIDGKKAVLPLAGLATCKGDLNFSLSIVYTDANRTTEKTSSPASYKAKCKK